MSAPQLARPEPVPGSTPEEAHHEAVAAAEHLKAATQHIGTGDPALAAFFAAFMRYASPEDIIRYSGAELAALVRLVYARSDCRMSGTSSIHIVDTAAQGESFARAETILIAINEDVPFLYDSCTAEVRAQGLHIRAAFHPVIATSRGTDGRYKSGGTALQESFIVLALEHISDVRQSQSLVTGLARVFADVRIAVRDWKPMLARLRETADMLKNNPPEIEQAELDENLAFLDWLADNHFTLLGARDYKFDGKGGGRLNPDFASGLGLLADPEIRVVRRGSDRVSLTPDVREFLTQPSPLIITKSNVRSTVHRHVHMDYVGVKLFDQDGQLKGERRFVGLFTATAYSQLPAAIPLLRSKVAQVLAGANLPHNSHDGKALAHILNTYPRDELFQIGNEDLLATALSILSLGQRPKVRAFLRFDKFDRFVSALVFVPRERYDSSARHAIHAMLAKKFDGRMSAAHPMLDDEALARVHFIVGRNPGPRPQIDVRELETEIAAIIRTWEDGFSDAILSQYGETGGATVTRRFGSAFPPAYRDTFLPREAVADIGHIETLLDGRAPGGTLHVQVVDSTKISCDENKEFLRLKVYALGDYVPLSDCLPVFENLGLKVIAEDAFFLTPSRHEGTTQNVALQSILMERNVTATTTNLAGVKQLLEDAFHAVWLGAAESDGFNRLVIEADLTWRNATILRAVAKFLRQAGIAFSQAYMESALSKNAVLAAQLVELFFALHDPDACDDFERRKTTANAIRERINSGLDAVPSADDDRIIRAFAAVIDATLRTNFFQRAKDGSFKPCLAFKLDSQRLEMLPAPRPVVEVFVYAPEVEGIHLRFGRVARGGLRWSDRAEDFRTEILGLVKAQRVKNAVIVPVGAKGGFYPKRLPLGGAREAVQAAAINAYESFIGALLDLTDNIGPDSAIVPPEDMVRYDDDDPYLVVAADKGTATFSDIANRIALGRGFWLGDAFASGGSNGYDHKKMGITARGAWEAVKRHFRELDRDIQRQPFTCIGVGDMSGDVFGNGMLLSKATKLIAAFDHRHIFFDPDPDPEKSWVERKRLFDLPRSSWDDYDKNLISQGGGVLPRTAKEISLSPELKAVSGLVADSASPQEVIRGLLTADVDLLFFGGIGTYIKASTQNHSDAGDRTNDGLRVDGRDIRATVIGEGANLGVTQLGRIEYARKGGDSGQGGRINTDAIDNSAGVDTSDHEVNIKILMNGPLRRKEISQDARDELLSDMTSDVSRLVLKNNIDQTLAISVAEHTAVRDLDASARLIRDFERAGKLDRALETLPDDEAFRDLAREGRGLTRPEIAVLLSYAKLELYSAVVESALPGDPAFHQTLGAYFPPLAVERFAPELEQHRLKREIVATQLVNWVVNLAGPLYAHRMREVSNAPLWCAARAFVLADGTFGLSQLNDRLAGLDLRVPAAIQHRAAADIGELLRRSGRWFLTHIPTSAGINETLQTYRAGATALKGKFAGIVSPLEVEAVQARIDGLTQAGVPLDVAEDVGVLPLLGAVPEIVLLSTTAMVPVKAAAAVYFGMGEMVGLDRLRALAAQVVASDHWDRLALRRTVDDLYTAQRLLSAQALAEAEQMRNAGDRAEGMAAARAWAEKREDELDRTRAFLKEMEHGGTPSVAKLTLANRQVQNLAASTPENRALDGK